MSEHGRRLINGHSARARRRRVGSVGESCSLFRLHFGPTSVTQLSNPLVEIYAITLPLSLIRKRRAISCAKYLNSLTAIFG